MAYFAHTDTVPGTPWHDAEHHAFVPVVDAGRLYGRGACDMKGSLASMLAAASRLDPGRIRQPLYIVCTADEEVGYGGAEAVARESRHYRELVGRAGMHAIIGEPTLLNVVYAHKGGAAFSVVAHGEPAHTSTAEGSNANWKLIPFLIEMQQLLHETETDPSWRDDEFEPPLVNLTISVSDDQPAMNVKAAYAVCRGAFRQSPRTDVDGLLQRIRAAAAKCQVDYQQLDVFAPVYTDPSAATVATMVELTGGARATTVPYGTDASALTGLREVVVCGPGSIDQAHKQDEWIAVDQLHAGADLYQRCAERWCY
jgi:acetylornithine deacetylase